MHVLKWHGLFDAADQHFSTDFGAPQPGDSSAGDIRQPPTAAAAAVAAMAAAMAATAAAAHRGRGVECRRALADAGDRDGKRILSQAVITPAAARAEHGAVDRQHATRGGVQRLRLATRHLVLV